MRERSFSSLIIAALTVAVVGTTALLALSAPGILLIERAVTIAAACMIPFVIAVAVAGYGLCFAVPAARLLTGLELLLISFGCGIGLFTSAVLVLGIAGVALPEYVLGLILVGWIIGFVVAVKRPQPFVIATEIASGSPFLVVILICAAAVLIFSAALTPPLLYDVTEYHIGAINEYLGNPGNRIAAAPHNFYARFPFPIESLYYTGLILERWAGVGDFSPKLINLLFTLCSAGLIYCMLLRMGVNAFWRASAVLLFLTHPLLLEVTLDAYIDTGTTFLTVAALFLLWIITEKDPADLHLHSPLILPAGLLFGTAITTKYTVLQLYVIPFLLLIAPVAFRTARAERRLRVLFYAAVLALLPVVFWFGKNVYFYGNPLEPFFQKLFRPHAAEAIARESFYIDSHYPQALWTSAYWTSFPRRFGQIGWIYFAPMIAIFRTTWKSRMRLILFVVLAYASWNLIRESQPRFMLPAILLIVVLGVEAISRVQLQVFRGMIAGFLLLHICANITGHAFRIANGGTFSYILGFEYFDDRRPNTAPAPNSETALDPNVGRTENTPRREFYRQNLGALAEAMIAADHLPSGSGLLLVYEARPYLFAHRSVYNTVFDASELLRIAHGAKSAAEVRDKLSAAGITHVLINPEELRRFIEQYARPSQLRMLGSPPPHEAYFRTQTPEDFYPPFYRDPEWKPLRAHVIEFLRKCRNENVQRFGTAPMEITLSRL